MKHARWELLPDTSGTLTREDAKHQDGWRSTEVPGSWHRLHPYLLDYQGVVWYRTVFRLKRIPPQKRFLLNFGAVDYLASVFVNGKPAGEHEGGYTPFELDVTDRVVEGDNELYVRVMDPVDDSLGTEGISYWHIPHGKQNWYVQNSGIWQDVTIAVKPDLYIESARVTADIDGHFSVQIAIVNHSKDRQTADGTVIITDSDGNTVFTETINPDLKNPEFVIKGKVSNPRLWDVGQPNIYTVNIRLGEDSFTDRFGFRELRVHQGKLYLNGHPFYMMAALDQDFYPETVYETPSEAYLRDQMLKARALGLNTLRCHIKIPDPRYLKLADELGLLVWYELPNWDVFHEDVKARARETLDAMLDRDWNHPSLVIVGIINESWGVDLSKPDQRAWLKEAFEYAKSQATGRLIVDNSACWGNFHLKTDINDYHTYWSIPDNHEQFSETVRAVAKRPSWLFSPHGDAEETGQEVLMISEFGTWGLPKLPEQKPFWFDRLFLDDWITLPEGVLNRFDDYGYGRIFKDYDDLAETSQLSQANALKWQIEEIRLQPEIQGYVITELTDINWESNGLLDMWRHFKKGHETLAMVQNEDVVIPRLDRYAYWEDETVDVNLTVSHYSRQNLPHTRIIAERNGVRIGEFEMDLDSVGVFYAGSIPVPVSKVSDPGVSRIDLTMLSENNRVISRNFIEYSVYARPPEKDAAIQDDILVTDSLDHRVLEYVKQGGNVIAILDGESGLPESFPYQVTSRNEDWYDGNWASNLNWVVHNKGPFKELNSRRALEFEARPALPDYVISGIPPGEFRDVLAGMYVGWLYLNSATVMQLSAGEGKLILTTFKLNGKNLQDPFSVALLNALKTYILSETCQPDTQWDIFGS
jgi:hypothetical protein